jgi:hypothetical protein
MVAEPGHLRLSGAAAVVSFSTYPQRLITLAESLAAQDEFSIAVVVAHMAAEIAASRKLGEAFEARGIADLEDAITGFFSGSNLANDRIRSLYSVLTTDSLTAQPFWADFKKSCQLRNEIAHSGVIAARADAEMAIKAASSLIKHLGKWGGAA